MSKIGRMLQKWKSRGMRECATCGTYLYPNEMKDSVCIGCHMEESEIKTIDIDRLYADRFTT